MDFNIDYKNDAYDKYKRKNLGILSSISSFCIQKTKTNHNLSSLLQTSFIISSRKIDLMYKSFAISFFSFSYAKNPKINKKLEFMPIEQIDDSTFPEEIEEIVWSSHLLEHKSIKKNSTFSISQYIKDEDNMKNNSSNNTLIPSSITFPNQNLFDNLNMKKSSDLVSPNYLSNDERKLPLEKKNTNSASSLDVITKDKQSEDKNMLPFDNNDAPLSTPTTKPVNLRNIRLINESKYQKLPIEDYNSIITSLNPNQSLSTNINSPNKVFVKDDIDKEESFPSSSSKESADAFGDNDLTDAKNVPISNLQLSNQKDSSPTFIKRTITTQNIRRNIDEGDNKTTSSLPSTIENDIEKDKESKIKNHFTDHDKTKKVLLHPSPYSSSSAIDSFHINGGENDDSTASTVNQAKSNNKSNREENVIIDKDIVAIMPRPLSNDLFSDSITTAESFNRHLDLKESKIVVNESSITVNRLDIKIIGDFGLTNQNRSKIKEIEEESFEEKDYNNNYNIESLNKNYLWRYKVKL